MTAARWKLEARLNGCSASSASPGIVANSIAAPESNSPSHRLRFGGSVDCARSAETATAPPAIVSVIARTIRAERFTGLRLPR